MTEIFKSIQGESTWAGLPCTFIRLTGCHLRCSWCDTVYAYTGGTPMTLSDVLHQVEELGAPLVEVTGGEPLLQESCVPLLELLLQNGYTVLVETSGTVSVRPLPTGAVKIMDLKCPSSGMAGHNRFENILCLGHNDEIKFVVGERRDFDWSCDIVRRYDLPSRVGAVLFSPVVPGLPYDMLARWILECGLKVRLQLQLHKVIWPELTRGV